MKYQLITQYLVLAIASFFTLVESQQDNNQQSYTANQQCDSITVRKEIRATSQQEWAMIRQVVTQMMRDGWFDWYGSIHNNNFNFVHGNSMFFPFHRRFVRDFEMTGQRYNPSFFVPYWDSAQDWQNPAGSAVLKSNYLGGNGRGSNNCVMDGIQGGATYNYPNRKCLRRVFNGQNGSIQTWFSPTYINNFVNTDKTMADFRSHIEFSIHGAVHLGLAGDMMEDWSPVDFAFMTHHANLDRLWAIWQQQPNGNGSGTLADVMDGPGPNGIQNLRVNNIITAYSDTIQTVMTLGTGLMCYRYDAISQRSSGPDDCIFDHVVDKDTMRNKDIYKNLCPENSKNSRRALKIVEVAQCVPVTSQYETTYCSYALEYSLKHYGSGDTAQIVNKHCEQFNYGMTQYCFPVANVTISVPDS
ncbi:hypothetical protein H4219_002892 [Mycoemilia scoparia]|uniref:Tyrosinase copper-binding domain-containing protein n=1 Tax=Mycoemilia scoparia TaxID=417184 RepID=A0A9W7ZWE7_9FUNG|nr:hypothetical protein H4219_002892 [Mycoemilia scoparia]